MAISKKKLGASSWPRVEAMESRRLLASLVWSDEFNGAVGSAPDSTRWSYDLGGGGWGNNELEVYTNSLQNACIVADPSATDGRALAITAIKQTDGTYTSARLNTLGKMSIAYGRWEARAKVPYGQGMWPAIWMLGGDLKTTGWPGCGEVDIMENIGKEPSSVHGTLHGPGYSGGNGLSGTYTLPGGAKFSDAYHVFAVDWSPTTVRFYVDGNLYETRTRADLPAGTNWVYDHPFFGIVNLAVGGMWPGNPDGTTAFPQKFLIDYYRVYSEMPDGWSDTDVGATGKAGGAGLDAPTGVWGARGSGADIWGTSDQFNFASKPLSADGELIAQMNWMTNTDTWAKAGLMFRASTAADAPFAMLVQMPSGELAFQWRTTTGASADWTGSRAGGTSAGKWIRLVRSGNAFSAYYATTGSTPVSSDWIQIGTQTIGMPTLIRAGLAVTSHSNAALCTATFANVSVNDSIPVVQSVMVNDGAVQRSMVTALSATFSEPVALSTGTFTLLTRAGAVVSGVTLNPIATSGDQKTWDITFTGLGLEYGSLPDGAYRLLVSASTVHDLAGTAVVADVCYRFFRLFGDSNGDRMVNGTDVIAFRQALSTGTYVSHFDCEGSGTLTDADYSQLRRRLIRRLV